MKSITFFTFLSSHDVIYICIKDDVLILRMFAKCLSVNLFLSAVLIFFMHEKNCSQQYVLPHMHNNFLDKSTIRLNSLNECNFL